MTLTSLSNGQPGIRSLLTIEAHSPSLEELTHGATQGVHKTASEVEPSRFDVLDFVASDESLDRYGEVICAPGWRLEKYRSNPVFQNAHQYGDIVFTLGKALITEVRKHSTISSQPSTALFQRIQFATDVNPMARIAYGLYRGKFLNAVSVGFIPLRWEDPSSPGGYGGQVPPSGVAPRRRYLEQELLEVSAVAIPANPNALALGVKSGAVTRSDLVDTLDLLRSLTVDYGPWRPAHILDTPLSTENTEQFLALARELRRILRRA